MSQRRRLPNSLRWRAVGWMEMGLSQADAARRLNVSRSVVQRLWDQYQSEDSVSRRPVPGRPRATTPAEDRFLALSARRRRTTTVPQLVADHFQASGRRISATTVRNRLHYAGLYARRPVVCVPLNGRQRRNRLCWAREHVSWTQQQWASVLFTDESRFTMESDSGRLLIWREQRTRYHQSNTVERHSYRGGGILVWAGISLGGHTDLHMFHGGTVTGLRYRDETLDPYVRPYAAAIGNDFILMDDNARPHRARIVEEYHGLERMEWPARFPDLNPIEHLWDYLGREVAALNPPPRSLHELKQGLLCVWSSLPIPVSDNLINSMGNRCRQYIQEQKKKYGVEAYPEERTRDSPGRSLVTYQQHKSDHHCPEAVTVLCRYPLQYSPTIESMDRRTIFVMVSIYERERKLDDAGAIEINRLYPESRRKVEKERPISEFTPLAGGGWRKRAADEDETGVTSRGREWKSAGRGIECCFFLFAAGMKKKRVCKEKLTDTTAGGTKLEPALTLIPVLMRGKCV
ncbi:transposable element Tcb2 transposase [Trichonephila clavipes]|nr:transposable element Tcb2 transposase [Trichonephila clavipes]